LNPTLAQNKSNGNQDRPVTGERSKTPLCSINEVKKTKKVNPEWKSQVKQLDELGVQKNSTVVKLVKQYEAKEVESAIALVRTRKRDGYIENLAGYFVVALKEKNISRR
jgi:hypothetical protein